MRPAWSAVRPDRCRGSGTDAMSLINPKRSIIMIFNITYDPSVTAAQQTAVDAVANFFERHYTEAVTVNITVNFADLSAGNGLGRSTTFLNTYSYNNIRTDLAAHQISADDAAGALPPIDP